MNNLLIPRFLARQIDNVLINLMIYSLYVQSSIHPLLIMGFVNLAYSLLEAFLNVKFNTSIGKFFLGLSIKNNSYKEALLRSLSVNFVVQGMGVSIIQLINYVLIFLSKNFFWQKNEIIEQEHSKKIRGYIVLLMMTMFFSTVVFFNYARKERLEAFNKQSSEAIKNSIDDEVIHTIIVYFPNFVSFDHELWMENCVLGAKKGFDAYGEKTDFDEVVKICQIEGQKYSNKKLDTEETIIYACSLGLGLSMQMMFKEEALNIINNHEGEQLLKESCFPYEI